MRLVKISSSIDEGVLEIEEFQDNAIPPYAILSHRWGIDEVSFQDVQNGQARTRRGFAKIQKCCHRAGSDGFRHVWIDTCCIDKTSSQELSEAINSMYYWYSQAGKCYAHLADVVAAQSPSETDISQSEWFTRGWTLQELLSPLDVFFVDRDWDELGTKSSLREKISAHTGIPLEILSREKEISSASVAQRMSWAAHRETTRVEDRAYCLMGIFDINMPLLYGEREKAFIRLQEEIVRRSDDHSLLAWKSLSAETDGLRNGVLASSPAAFADSKNIVPYYDDASRNTDLRITSKGVQVELNFICMGVDRQGLAVLPCIYTDKHEQVALHVRDPSGHLTIFERVNPWRLESLDFTYDWGKLRSFRQLCIKTAPSPAQTTRGRECTPGQEESVYSLRRPRSDLDGVMQTWAQGSWRTSLRYAIDHRAGDLIWMVMARPDAEARFGPTERWNFLLSAVLHKNIPAMDFLCLLGVDINAQRPWEDIKSFLHDYPGKQLVLEDVGFLRTSARGILTNPYPLGPPPSNLVKEKYEHARTQPQSMSLLRAAIQTGCVATTGFLLNRGADIERSVQSLAPLLWAVLRKDKTMVRYLLDQGACINTSDLLLLTPLHYMSLRGLDDTSHLAHFLLDRGADVNARCLEDYTPLLLATAYSFTGQIDIIRLLVQRGADVHARESRGNTALHLSAAAAQAPLVQLILDAGADVSARNHRGATPLLCAAGSWSPALLQMLLDAGADVNAQDDEQNSPLREAIESKCEGTVSLLLARGANVDDGLVEPLHEVMKRSDVDHERADTQAQGGGGAVNAATTPSLSLASASEAEGKVLAQRSDPRKRTLWARLGLYRRP